MTKQEALSLRPGDIIKCKGTGYMHRTIINSYVSKDTLHWSDYPNQDNDHIFNYNELEIVSRKKLNLFKIY